jgi:hypothetical protein
MLKYKVPPYRIKSLEPPGAQDLCTLGNSFTQSVYQEQLCSAFQVDVLFVVKITQNAQIHGEKCEIMNVKTGGTYSYHSALNGYGSSKPGMGEIEQNLNYKKQMGNKKELIVQ